jgi:hypothetical protein
MLSIAVPLCAFFFLNSALAQHLDAKSYSGLRWRMIGPHRGGRTIAVSGIEGQPNVYYFGGVAGGVWKTTNAGRTWAPVFDSQPIASIGALALAPSDPSVIYVGSGEGDLRSDITYGDGVYKSTDGGKTWSNIGLRWVMLMARIQNAVCFVRPMAAPHGRRPYTRTRTRARLTSHSILMIRAPSMQVCGARGVRRGAVIHRSMVPVRCTGQLMGE